MPQIVLWSWELGPDLSPNQARVAYQMALRGDPCSYCGGIANHSDHIQPRRFDGPDGWDNLTAACGRCNQSKGHRTLLGFLLKEPVGTRYGAWLDSMERQRAYMVAERAAGRAA